MSANFSNISGLCSAYLRRMSPFRAPVSASKNSVPGVMSETGSMTAWGVGSSGHISPTTHTLRLYWWRDYRDSAAISKTCLPNFLISAVSARIFAANELISGSSLCIKKFRSWRDVGDRFDDWVGSWQFGPYQPHHPVLRNRKSRPRLPIGHFCRDFRGYRSAILVSGHRCGLSSRFLASRLSMQKFRSRRTGF